MSKQKKSKIQIFEVKREKVAFPKIFCILTFFTHIPSEVLQYYRRCFNLSSQFFLLFCVCTSTFFKSGAISGHSRLGWNLANHCDRPNQARSLFTWLAATDRQSRVDVSETFSADQLWFRILSGLFQRCSLPENLWTALIQLWTALKTEIFKAENQCWNSAVSALIFSATALIQSWTALISSETALNSADFWIIQNDNLWLLFHFLQNFSKYLNFEAHNSGFQPSSRIEVSKKTYFSIFVQAKDITNTWIFGFTVTAQVTKQIWFNFSKTFLRLQG